jgi:hypothetical protein
LMKRRMVPVMRAASSITWVPYVLFMVKARLLPKLLSTCVYAAAAAVAATADMQMPRCCQSCCLHTYEDKHDFSGIHNVMVLRQGFCKLAC